MVEKKPVQFRLRFPCPGDKCSKSKVLSWYHSNCNGEIYIDIEGYMWCEKHKDKSFIQHWGFKCNEETHTGGFEKFAMGRVFSAISYAIESLEDANEHEFIKKLSDNIMHNWITKQ